MHHIADATAVALTIVVDQHNVVVDVIIVTVVPAGQPAPRALHRGTTASPAAPNRLRTAGWWLLGVAVGAAVDNGMHVLIDWILTSVGG